MTIKQLLTGAAVAALMAGAATAQVPSIDNEIVNDPASDFTGTQVLPSEKTASDSGDLILDLALADVFSGMGAGGQVTARFTLTNATFSATVPLDAWDAATEANCDFGSPSLGGGVGGTSVEFQNVGQLNLCTGANADNGDITLPIEVTSPGSDVSVLVEFIGTADVGSFANLSDSVDVLSYEQYVSYTIAFDNSAAPPVGQFDSNGDALQGSGVIGLITTNENPNVTHSDIGTPITGAGDIVDATDVIVTFPGGVDGIDVANVDLDGVACSQGAGAEENVFTCTTTGAAVDGWNDADGEIVIVDDGDNATFISVQTPTAAIDANGDAGFGATDAAATDIAALELDDGLASHAIGGSAFAWTRIGDGGTQSNFRVVLANSADASGITRAIVTCGDASSSDLEGLEISIPAGADPAVNARPGGNTVAFNSQALGAASGFTGNCDITSVALERDEALLAAGDVTGASINRLLIQRNGFGLSDL